jgi:soluble lytic murein transglycosylase-like protein
VVALAASLTALALIVDNQQHGWARLVPPPADASDSPLPPEQVEREPVAVMSPAEDRRYRALGGFVARKYRVSQDMAYDLVRLAHGVGHQIGLDPLLIIAVIAIESRFNPIAESMAGAKGLMQIIPKYHTGKFEEYGGEKAVFDPEANVKVGARILKEYIRLTGNVGIALQMYAGALGDGEDEYTTKVMNEQQRLKQVLAPPAAPRGGFTKTSSSPAVVSEPLEPVTQ